jgi:hypothetical protein
MRTKFIASILPVVLLLVIFCLPASAQQSEPTTGISVSGTAEVGAAPDIAYVVLGVRTRSAQAAEASSSNAAQMQRVIQAIMALDIPQADIETVQYSLQPFYEYPRDGTPRLVGYEATNLIRVTVRNLGIVGRVIDAAVSAGANVVQGTTFALSDESEIRATALTKAVEDAKTKANVMAQALGIRLGVLLKASETVPPIVYPVAARAMEAGAPETPIIPGQIQVRATVNLVYAIFP